MQELLLYLWERAVGPVLSGSLGFLGPTANLGDVNPEGQLAPSTGLPRVFWIGVGELSRAPFHAAGNHRPGSTDNTLSRAISSYVPSIKALVYSRRRPFRLGAREYRGRVKSAVGLTFPNILLVTMAETPGEFAPLPRVEQEVQSVMDVFDHELNNGTPDPGSTQISRDLEQPSIGDIDPQNRFVTNTPRSYATCLSQPTAATVLSHLPHYDFVHFACHGVSDSVDPFQSSLLLAQPTATSAPASASEHNHDAMIEGTTSPAPSFVVDKLTALDITRIYIEKANSTRLSLAYLSACSTADNASIDLSDETIHLATAFQLAGFSHVLATLWQGKDEACMVVAEHFYQRLFEPVKQANPEFGPGAENWDSGHGIVAKAMHDAVVKARKGRNAEKPLLWAAFIHIGA